MRRITPIVGALLALALSLAACGDDDAAFGYDGDAVATTAAPATTMASATAQEGPAPDSDDGEAGGIGTNAAGTDAATAAALTPEDLGRLIVYTATISVEVDDVVAAGAEAQAAVAGLGGILFGQETVTGDGARSILTIKVPPENFHAALERLAGVGKLLGQSVYADDVTERVVDLQSQITTATASVERLRTFLENATDLEEVAELERELLARETDLEVLRGRLRTLEDQVALATIVLTLTEPVPPTPEPSYEIIETGYAGHDGGAACPGSDELRIDEDAPFTACIVFVNTGDTALADIEVRDQGLRADADDFVLVEGDLERPLPPDGALVFAYEGEGHLRRQSTDPTAQATAVDADGDPLRISADWSRERLRLTVDEDDSLPGFLDAMEKAWNALQRGFGVVVVLAGALVPFLWVLALLGGFIWWRRRRDAAADSGAADDAAAVADDPTADDDTIAVDLESPGSD